MSSVGWPEEKWYHFFDKLTRIDEQLDVIGRLLDQIVEYLRSMVSILSGMTSTVAPMPYPEQPVVIQPIVEPGMPSVVVATPPPVHFENVDEIKLKRGEVHEYKLRPDKILLITSLNADVRISFDLNPKAGYKPFPLFARTYLIVYPSKHEKLYIEAVDDTTVYIMYGRLMTKR